MAASGPKCPNKNCGKSDFGLYDVSTAKTVDTIDKYNSKYTAGIVYCKNCGKIVGFVSA